jgi:DNA-binding NarL/FixJ family response regulator
MNKKRIFIVDDHPLVREWLANLINQEADLVVCGEAEDRAHARQGIAETQPAVAIVDISLKGGSGIELIKDLKSSCPDVAVIVLSMHDEALYAERALHAGARGYIMKRETTKKIIGGIHRVINGELCISDPIHAAIAERFIDGMPIMDQSPVTLLSDRELDVFMLLGQGRETKQIAGELKISTKTVQTYCARIKEKLKLDNISELLREAVRWEEQRQRS